MIRARTECRGRLRDVGDASSARSTSRRGATLALALTLAFAGAAWIPPHAAADVAADVAPPRTTSRTITIDGRFDDWPRDVFLAADERYVYFRLTLPDVRNLQASPTPVVVALDAQVEQRFAPDLRITFAPPATGGQGVAVELPGGIAIGHAAVDLIAAPTYAARAFELRIAREVRDRPELTAALASGAVRMQASALRRDGSPLWRGRAYEIALPPRAASAPADAPVLDGANERAVATVPVAADDEVRVVSWNVLLASPRRKPEPFARILRALKPDVLLLQEWEGATPDELRAWLDANVPGEPAWSAVTGAGWGVALAARGELASLIEEAVARPAAAPADPRRGDQALRLVAAVATTRLGPLCVASLHLKCCGSIGSREDEARRAEAEAAGATLGPLLDARAPCVRVAGGDLNLVGSRTPLDVLAQGLGDAAGPLAIVESPVLGDHALYTWSESWSRFSPGRLDYLLHGSGVRVARSFALDTRRLDDAALAAAGLERKDSSASDHLPLALDLAASPATGG